jgi:hypothetical protein
MLHVMGGRPLVGGLLLAAAALASGCDSDQPKSPEHQPTTVAEFFDALGHAIDRDGEIFHSKVEIRSRENGVELLLGTTEGWIDADAAQARVHWQKGLDNKADVAERTVSIYRPEGVYTANLDSDDAPSFRLPIDSELCLPEAPTQLVALLACGFLNFGPPELSLTVEPSSFEGRATVSLRGTWVHRSPAGSEEFPIGGPTPHPVLADATEGEYRLHLDPTTYLPVVTTSSLNTDPNRRVFGSELRFTSDFVASTSLAKDWFESGSIGYVAPDKKELGSLDDPKLATPVYWLGRTFDPGKGLRLTDFRVNGYSPGRQRGKDEPNIQIGLGYSGPGGFVRLDHFPPGDWEAFKARLGGNFPWTWCSESREFTVGAAKVTILSGYESFPYRTDFGVTVIPVTSGQDPPTLQAHTPTVPPLHTESCPNTARDRFMAEVRFPDATVVINGTLSYGGQDGRAFGAYDSAEALEVVARGLRLRRAGE